MTYGSRNSNFKHGQKGTRLYTIWRGMKARCDNPNEAAYSNYGGRGIHVCDEWRDDFLSFSNWAKNNGYQEHLTIDRIDVNGNYCPDNCRWATRKQQENNKRNNVYITIGDKTQSLAEWCEETGINYQTAHTRIRQGWEHSEAVLKKSGRFNAKSAIWLTHNGETKPLPEFAKEYGLKADTLRSRIQRLKWSTERALTTPTEKGLSNDRV